MALFKTPTDVVTGKRFAWDRRRTERTEDFDLFHKFLTSADRDLAKLAQEHNVQRSYVDSLVKKHEWMERVAAYEFHELNKEVDLDVSIIPSKESSVMEMNEKHLAIAAKAQYVAALGFGLLENFIRGGDFEHESGRPKKPPLSPEDVVKLARFGVELERTVNGQASKINETIVNYSNLSDDDLAKLQELMEKAEGESDA